MKFLLLLWIAFIFGCNSSSNNFTKAEDSALNAQADSEYKARFGPKKRNVNPEEQKKAFSNLYFGLREKEARKLFDFIGFHELGTGKYFIRDFYTYNDSLYQIDIESIPKTADKYNINVKLDWDNLANLSIEKYGDPDIETYYPPFHEQRSGYIKFTHVWQLGDKVVKIGVGEEDAEYYAICSIYSQRMKAMEDQNDIQKVNDKTKKDANLF